MGAQADVTADDLVSSLLHSITSGSGSAASSSSSASSASSSSSSSSASASASSSASSSGSSSAPAATTAAPVATTTAPSTPTPTTSVRGVDNGDASSDSGGSGAAVGIGLAMAALVMAAVVLLYLRRRKRIKAMKQRRDQFGGVDELGPAQPSIELPAPKRPLYRPSQDPGVRGSSMYSSSSSRDGTSVFHTVGGLSPTSRKLGSQFRASSISSVDSVNLQAPAGATTSGRKLQRVMSGREMDEDDELQYEQLKSTAANARVLDDRPTPLRLSNVSSVNSLHDSMSSDKYAHGDGLGAAASPPQQQEPDRQQLSQALDSSVITGRNKRTGSVYDSIPALAGEQMTSEAPPTPAASGEAVTPAMGRRPPPPPPPAGVQAFQPMTEGGSYVAALPGGLTSFANADDLEFSLDAQMRMDAPSERASTMSTTSTDSGCTTRSGSLIGVVATSDADEIQI